MIQDYEGFSPGPRSLATRDVQPASEATKDHRPHSFPYREDDFFLDFSIVSSFLSEYHLGPEKFFTRSYPHGSN